MNTMQKNKTIYLLSACFLLFSAQSCKKAATHNQYGGPVQVTGYTVKSQTVDIYDSYPGTVVALNEVELRSQVSGYVTGIYFKEGSQVTAGGKLYEIDRRKYQAAFEQATANAEIAGANLQKAQRDADRYTKLNEQNAIAKQIFEDAITNLQNSKMQLLAAKAVLLNAETDFNYSLITAPFSGTIGFSLVKPGTFVNAGQTLLNTLSSDDPIAVDFIVNEKSLPEFIRLKSIESGKADSTFKITLPDNSGYPYWGRLSVIDRAVNPMTGTIKLRLVFPNRDKILRSGMNCSVKVLHKGSGSQITIPYKAVVEQMGEYFVYLIDSMKVKQVKIEPGSSLGESIIVKQGVKPGDNIVLDGLQKLRNGSMVQVGNQTGRQETVKR
jgi:membrane fusion protein (multidrug efflux system)